MLTYQRFGDATIEILENECSDIQLERVGDEGLWGKDGQAPPWSRDCVGLT